MRIITNNQPRNLLDAHELTPAERVEFDYLDWPAIDNGSDSATFFRYRGQVYDLAEFETTYARDDELAAWDGFAADSFFSGVAIRLVDDNERVVCALILA